MEKVVVAVRDEAAEQFLPLVTEDNASVAIRNFQNAVWSACNEEEGMFWTAPQDFALYQLATVDTESGAVVPIVPISRIATAGEMVFEFKRWKESEDFNG